MLEQRLRKSSCFLIIFAIGLALSSVSLGSGHPKMQTEFVPGEILVKFKPGTPGQAIADIHRQNHGQKKEGIPGINVQLIRVPLGQEEEYIAVYQRNPSVLFAELNALYQTTATPNDPEAAQQWQYNNTGQTGGRPGADIDAFEAWEITTGSPKVAIAILDTGIDQSHEDLSSKILKNVDFSGSGTVDDMHGHGTHVAGSAAAISNNGKGVAGTCPDCALYNVKVLDDRGLGSSEAIANGITWAADNGAKVISMSLGGSQTSSTIEAAVNYAWSKGSIVIAAAGNTGEQGPQYPAYFENVIAVAATDHNDKMAHFSTYGSWVNVAAPGHRILSTMFNNSYTMLSGTSMAAPHVAGVAGLVWSTGICDTDNSCVRHRIETRADPIAGTGASWTHGRINAFNSVTSFDPPPLNKTYLSLIQLDN
jgi:thermitase